MVVRQPSCNALLGLRCAEFYCFSSSEHQMKLGPALPVMRSWPRRLPRFMTNGVEGPFASPCRTARLHGNWLIRRSFLCPDGSLDIA
jgi:hypothetical protein